MNTEPCMLLLGQCCLEERGTQKYLWDSPLPPIPAPPALPGVHCALGTNPWTLQKFHLLSPCCQPAPVPGAQLHRSWGTPGQPQKLPELSPSAKMRRAAPQGSYTGSIPGHRKPDLEPLKAPESGLKEQWIILTMELS